MPPRKEIWRKKCCHVKAQLCWLLEWSNFSGVDMMRGMKRWFGLIRVTVSHWDIWVTLWLLPPKRILVRWRNSAEKREPLPVHSSAGGLPGSAGLLLFLRCCASVSSSLQRLLIWTHTELGEAYSHSLLWMLCVCFFRSAASAHEWLHWLQVGFISWKRKPAAAGLRSADAPPPLQLPRA